MTTVTELKAAIDAVRTPLWEDFSSAHASRLHDLEDLMLAAKPRSMGEAIDQLEFLADYLLETDGDHPGEEMLRNVIDFMRRQQ